MNLIPFTRKIPAIADASMMVTNEVIGVILGSPWPAPPDELSKVSIGEERAAATRAVGRPVATRPARSTASGRRPLTCTTARSPT